LNPEGNKEKSPKIRVKLESLFLIAFVFVLTFVSIFSWGIANQNLGADLFNSAKELSDIFGYGDNGSFLKAAIELQELGGLTNEKPWVINIWPPGMVWLNALLIQVFGSYFALAYASLLAITWASLISYVALKVLNKFGLFSAFAFSALLLASSPLQVWIFGFGFFYSEGFSTAAFIWGLILLIESSQTQNRVHIVSLGVLSGSMLAIAAYFRASYSILETGLFVFALLTGIALILGNAVKGLFRLKRLFAPVFLSTTSAWVSMFLLMEPWLRFVESSIRFQRSWSVVSGNFFRGAWSERSLLPAFLSDGGGGWACILEPDFCSEIAKFESSTGGQFPIDEITSRTVQAAILNPTEFLQDRLFFLSKGWFSVESSMGNPNLIWGAISLAAILWLSIVMAKRILKGELVFVVVFGSIAILLIPMMVGHVEPRYFVPIKLLVLLVPWIFNPARRELSSTMK
jgi:hypothetical protein